MTLKTKSFDLAEKKFSSKQKGVWLARPEYEYEFIDQYFKKYSKLFHNVPHLNVELVRIMNYKTLPLGIKSHAGFLDKNTGHTDVYDKNEINTPDLQEYIDEFKNTKKRFTIFTTSTAYWIDRVWHREHALAIIYDKKYHELDIFNANQDNINEFREITTLFFKRIYGNSLKIVFPNTSLPFYNLFDECQERKNGELYKFSSPGICVPATLWYLELRLSNPKLTRTEIYKKIVKNVKDKYHLCEIYLGYAQFIQKTINKYDYTIDEDVKVMSIKDPKTNKKVNILLSLTGAIGLLGLLAYGIKKLRNKK